MNTHQQQLAYYHARAAEYDEWWLRNGRYDRGPALNAYWAEEGAEVAEALEAFHPTGRILEMAGGTGIWSAKLLPYATEFKVLDGSTEMLALNAAKLGSPRVRYVQADLFQWQPEEGERYDTVFFGFWLSHVPQEKFEGFWSLVQSCLAPGGRVFFVDSRHEPTSTANDHQLPPPDATVVSRKLKDGREFQIWKVFHDPAELTRKLRDLGWEFEIQQTERYFIHGVGRRAGKLGQE